MNNRLIYIVHLSVIQSDMTTRTTATITTLSTEKSDAGMDRGEVERKHASIIAYLVQVS